MSSGRDTARKAGKILEATGEGFFIPTPKQRQDLLIECATRGYASYARAFDILKVTKQGLYPQSIQIKSDFDSLRICEIKSTNRDLGQDWSGYFFSLSTAELLIAQSLKDRFRFVLVNTRTGSHFELTLTEVFARARAIYPSWSVRFYHLSARRANQQGTQRHLVSATVSPVLSTRRIIPRDRVASERASSVKSATHSQSS